MKKETKDDYYYSVCKVVLYIEENYSSNLTLEKLSKIASFSKYHFHRIFKSIVGENLKDYIIRVRLQSTTLKFKTNQKITQIAMGSGYETSASFTRAFKKHFNMTPREFTKYSKVKKGTNNLSPKFIYSDEEKVFYVRKIGEYSKSCREAWQVLLDFISTNNIEKEKVIKIGIVHDDPYVTPVSELRCDACAILNNQEIEPFGEVLTKSISSGNHAVFLHIGPYEEIHGVYDSIGDWIVENKIELRDSPMFVKYLDVDPKKVKCEDKKTEIYVPLV